MHTVLMRRRTGWFRSLVIRCASCFAIGLTATNATAEGADVAKSLRVAEGFTIEPVAAAPLVEHPVMAAFDDQGRLFVADHAGLNLPTDALLKQLPNKIRMLEDTDHDGRFDRSTVFADKLALPQGVAWYRGALYVASPPGIWRLEDTDGDGVADRREELVKQTGSVGTSGDLRGCFITPTGRIAWCVGRNDDAFPTRDGQPASQGRAARVFSCRPDGSDVEVFCGGGMDKSVEIAFTAEGDTLGTVTSYNPDATRHDALVHFVHGGVYPRKDPCTSEFKRTGPLLPALRLYAAVAPSGLARLEGNAWGDAYRDNFYSTQCDTHKVLRHTLTRQGTTYQVADEDFLVSDHADFHPTDVLQDADGSLLVVDNGSPSAQTAKAQVGGTIYRIRRRDAAPIEDPRGMKIDWDRTSDTEMADLLSDPRPAVVQRAVDFLAARGDAAIGSLATALFESTEYPAREQAVWTLARIGTENAMLLLRQTLADDDAPVRQAAVHAVGDLRDKESILPLIDLVGHDEPPIRREAAAALGRLGQAAAVPALLAALAQPTDRMLEHALIYALIEINNPAATSQGLKHANPQVQRGALIALDQMQPEALTRDQLLPLLQSKDRALKATVEELLAKRPK